MDLDVAVERAQAGDAEGFEALFRACGRPVVGYLRRQNVSDPDGLANEVFLRAFRTLHTFRGDGARFRSWLFTIAHHTAVDDVRRRRRRVVETTLEQARHTSDGDVETAAIAHAGTDWVRTVLDQLSSDQRDVLLLRVGADLSVDQTAAVLGKSHEAVKALQHRGVAALRRLLAEREAVTE